MALFRRPFRDLVERQLAFFADEHAEALADIDRARARAGVAPVEEAEEAYGDYSDRLDWAADDLRAICDAYARTLEEAPEEQYRAAFAKGVARRFPVLREAFLHDDA